MLNNSLIKFGILCWLTGWNSLEMVLLCHGLFFVCVDQKPSILILHKNDKT